MIRTQVKHMLCLNVYLGKNKMKKYSVGISILSSDFFDLQNTFAKIEKSDLDFVHLDVMDGVFVSNISFGPHFIKCLRPHSKKIFDVHLMVKNPLPYIDAFIQSGADVITVHVEAKNTLKSLKKIKQSGLKCGVVINPETSVKKVKKYLKIVDVVMVMTVAPGFGGQKFMPLQLEKVFEISKMIKSLKRKIDLQVDGGINLETGKSALKSGANKLVVGKFLFNQSDFKKTVSKLKKL